MNTIGIVLLVLGLLGMSIGVYGYTQNKDKEDKKKVYTWIGGSASLLLVIGIAMMFMGGDDSAANGAPKSPLNSLPNNPKDLANMENRYQSTLDNIRTKQEGIATKLNEQLRHLRRS